MLVKLVLWVASGFTAGRVLNFVQRSAIHQTVAESKRNSGRPLLAESAIPVFSPAVARIRGVASICI